MNDPLADFRRWEGQELGEDQEGSPGFTGHGILPPLRHVHVAGAHCTSSARRKADGTLVSAVYVRMLLGVIGTGPTYHIVEGIVDADVALQWAEALKGAAERSPLDIEAGNIGHEPS